MDAPSRYPLAWPQGRPRRRWQDRAKGSFVHNGKPIKSGDAATKVEAELRRLGAVYPILSSNLELRLDGRPRADRAEPADPGVCLYFQLKGQPFALACDTFTTVAQNIAALANHLDATRRIERYGVATASETLRAFQSLPPPSEGIVTPRRWSEVLGVPARATRAEIDAAYRSLARKAHPDNGGSTAAMTALNAARAQAYIEVTA